MIITITITITVTIITITVIIIIIVRIIVLGVRSRPCAAFPHLPSDDNTDASIAAQLSPIDRPNPWE